MEVRSFERPISDLFELGKLSTGMWLKRSVAFFLLGLKLCMVHSTVHNTGGYTDGKNMLLGALREHYERETNSAEVKVKVRDRVWVSAYVG